MGGHGLEQERHKPWGSAFRDQGARERPGFRVQRLGFRIYGLEHVPNRSPHALVPTCQAVRGASYGPNPSRSYLTVRLEAAPQES